MGIAGLAFFTYSYYLARDASPDNYAAVSPWWWPRLWECAVGFLPHNFHPARIFMGDSGAYMLGVVIVGAGILVTGQIDPANTSVGHALPAYMPRFWFPRLLFFFRSLTWYGPWCGAWPRVKVLSTPTPATFTTASYAGTLAFGSCSCAFYIWVGCYRLLRGRGYGCVAGQVCCSRGERGCDCGLLLTRQQLLSGRSSDDGDTTTRVPGVNVIGDN